LVGISLERSQAQSKVLALLGVSYEEKKVRNFIWRIGVLLMFVCPSVRANLSAKQAAEAFERLKTLEGTWQGISERGGRASLTISVIGRGSAVVETYRDADNDQMVTVYYLDGERLILRHYCVAKNQPRMEATTFDPSTGDLRFEFVDATNLAPGAGHMH